MSGSKNVIELNGKLYDASTGVIVGDSQSGSQPTVIQPQTKGKTVDGFFRKPGNHQAPPVSPKHVSAPQKLPKQAPRSTGKHAAAHQPHRANTLMRRGLKKPAVASPINSAPIAQKQPVINTEQAPVMDSRLARAKAVPQSAKISRFGVPGAASHAHRFVKKTSHVPVKPAPPHAEHHQALVDQRHAVAQEAASTTKEQSKVLKERLITESIKQARTPEIHHKTHKQHRVAHKLGISPKTLRFSSGALAVLLIAGFFAYQNAANISMRIASSRAGFSASTPGYHPSGFSMSGPVEYGPGQITLNFKSNSDQRNFHITQRVSNWNSEALLANFVTTNNKSYQTYQDKGRTVYIYDGSNATWVSGGVWYQIEGNSSLSSEQLLHIASSM